MSEHGRAGTRRDHRERQLAYQKPLEKVRATYTSVEKCQNISTYIF